MLSRKSERFWEEYDDIRSKLQTANMTISKANSKTVEKRTKYKYFVPVRPASIEMPE